MNAVLQDLRVRYQAAKLDISDCRSVPLEQLDQWIKEAIESGCDEPNAFVLSTIRGKRPRARVVLLKGIQQDKVIFYTNYNSAKGEEIKKNEKVSMTFLWLPLQRQVRIEGTVVKIDSKISNEYFNSRPRGSQLGAIASPQSKKVKDRAELEKLFANTEKKFSKVAVLPRPKNWGGYAVIPDYVEFWQGRDNRLHDRVCFELKKKSWKLFRLAP